VAGVFAFALRIGHSRIFGLVCFAAGIAEKTTAVGARLV